MSARLLRRCLAGAVATGAGALAWAALVEPRWFHLRHQTAPVLRPGAERPLRVLHLSDLHLQPRHVSTAAFLSRCRETGPDAVVVTGDIVGHPDAIDDAVELLAGVRGNACGIMVLGSNDRYGPTLRNPLRYLMGPSKASKGMRLDTQRLVDGLRAAGWHVLENDRVRIDSPAGGLDVVGLGDPHIQLDRPDRIDWSCPQEPVALRLGVVHSPYRRALDRFDSAGLSLALAGHTHGGQLRVPWIGALVTNCDLPRAQSRGLSQYGRNLWLHVSAGLGQSRYAPIRFACRPEATVLDLVAEPPQQ